MKELIGQMVGVVFCNGTLDTCIVLDIDTHLGFIKLCYSNDRKTIFWKNITEISSFNDKKHVLADDDLLA